MFGFLLYNNYLRSIVRTVGHPFITYFQKEKSPF